MTPARPGRLLLAVLVVVACAAQPAPRPGLLTPDTERELVALLTAHVDTLARQDRAAFDATYDHTRGAFALCMAQRFQLVGRVGARTVPPALAGLEPYGDGYLRAFVAEAAGYARYYFRRGEDGRWLITQPRRDEVGDERTRSLGEVTLAYWAIDEDVSELVALDAVHAREVALRHAIGSARATFAVRLYPTRELASRARCGVIASAFTADPARPELRIHDLWLTPRRTSLSAESQAVMRHEALHWVQDQMAEGAVRQADWWLVEGWPDYVSGLTRLPAFKRVACARLPDFVHLASGPLLDPDDSPDVTVRYYAYAYAMVHYFYERYGAMTYWEILRAFRDSRRQEVIYPRVLKISPERFRADWVAWARATYCP